MEVVGKSKAHVVLESCLLDSTDYFSDHHRILKCNPYCKNIDYHADLGIFQWTFEVEDPRKNPIVAIFFVRQDVEHLPPGSDFLTKCAAQDPKKSDKKEDNGGKLIRWISAETVPDIRVEIENTFIGAADAEICLVHLPENKTSVHFETNITLDFKLSFPLNLMPEMVLKFMSETIMSQIMQQATESMLCKVQADICCSDADIAAKGELR